MPLLNNNMIHCDGLSRTPDARDKTNAVTLAANQLVEFELPEKVVLKHPVQPIDHCGPGKSTVEDTEPLPWHSSPEHAEDTTQVFEELHGTDPNMAMRLAKALTLMPAVGHEFLGFRLCAELGRGAFGRVYLAQQGELANRLVVVKISLDLIGESQTHAQLQHPHIMPLYSLHHDGLLQATCMPYLGATTLAVILKCLRDSTSLPASGSALVQMLQTRSATVKPQLPEGSPTSEPLKVDSASPVLKLFETMTFVNAVLELGSRLADGLSHAHERGVLHRDLKPANILISNEGQPLLLDFNLAEDTKLRSTAPMARMGGTLPYMAPEQLKGFQNGAQSVDARSDVYSLGLILYELLTGRHPFARPRGALMNVLPQMITERSRSVPELRRWNKGVSPAAEAIVRHCLEPEPSCRYQTAQELRDDLERHLQHLPLRYAKEPSPWERGRKWGCRHPCVMYAAMIAGVATLILLTVCSVLAQRTRHLAQLQARHEAAASCRQVGEDLKTIQLLLSAPDEDPRQRDEAFALGRGILDRYRVLELPDWHKSPNVHALAQEDRRRLQEDVGELLLLLAWATARQAKTEKEPAILEQQLAEAWRFNTLAEPCYPRDAGPRALWQQRAELARLVGRDDEAAHLFEKAEMIPTSTVRDRYLLFTAQLDGDRLHALLPFLREASRQDASNSSVWLILGNCYASQGKFADAVACYDFGIALWPNGHWAYFRRALAYMERKDYRQAQSDLDEVIRLRPDVREAYFNRAVARLALGDTAGARQDLTHMLQLGPPQLRVYFARARVREKEGDVEGARSDRELGLQQVPLDEQDWTVRGLARQNSNPNAALEDFEHALQLNPRYRAALQNKASLLSERLGRTEEAVRVLDQVINLYPDYGPARAGRGVLLARLGQRDAALRDARDILQRDHLPFTYYQVAGIYALTSRQEPDDRLEAFRLLTAALQDGTGLDLLNRDRDLDPIRDEPEFQRIVESAREMRADGSLRSAKR